jgi:hypothetical protein
VYEEKPHSSRRFLRLLTFSTELGRATSGRCKGGVNVETRLHLREMHIHSFQFQKVRPAFSSAALKGPVLLSEILRISSLPLFSFHPRVDFLRAPGKTSIFRRQN